MGSCLPRHTYGFIRRELFPYYCHISSACAFLNLTLFALYHPSELLSDEQTTQVVASDIVADMHLVERSHGLGQEVGLFTSKSCRQLRASNPSYRQLSRQLSLYRALSSLCNLCCIACNGLSLYYLAAQLSAL
uniref:TMEM205-like domain-containing protein n=1 Tax=Accipiter nisus TaxID=211598 RepID=A0A8B9NFT8_9AVES